MDDLIEPVGGVLLDRIDAAATDCVVRLAFQQVLPRDFEKPLRVLLPGYRGEQRKRFGPPLEQAFGLF